MSESPGTEPREPWEPEEGLDGVDDPVMASDEPWTASTAEAEALVPESAISEDDEEPPVAFGYPDEPSS